MLRYPNHQDVFNGVIEDFREKLVSAFMTHRYVSIRWKYILCVGREVGIDRFSVPLADSRDYCSSDPSFEKAQAQDRFMDPFDAMRIRCHDCGCDQVLV